MDEEFFEEEVEVIELVDDEGNPHLFELVAEMELQGNTYKVLIPVEDEEIDDDEEVEVIILKSIIEADGEEYLVDIEDDEEWEMVADAWQELMESEEV